MQPPDNYGPYINGVSWPLVAIAGLFLGTRLYIKTTAHRAMWWDDHLLTASWLMLAAFAATNSYAVSVGFGKHIDKVPTENFVLLMMLSCISSIFSLLGAAWSKTSFALTLLRLTSGTMEYVVSTKYLIWGVIISLNLTLTFNTILPFIQCKPIARAWNPYIEGTCWERTVVVDYGVFAAAYSATMDFVLAIVPWLLILKLQMVLKEKIGVAICMSLGLVAGATSIVRAIKVPQVQSYDFTFESGNLSIWTVAEIATTIMATCIPVLRVLVHRVVSPNRNCYRHSGVDVAFVSKHNTTHTTPIICNARQQHHGGTGTLTGTKTKDSHESDDEERAIGGVDATAGGIVRVATVRIDYDRRSKIGAQVALDEASPDFEMERLPSRSDSKIVKKSKSVREKRP
ncbi:uncharacterized protein BCR38DRAFT_332542 [Pseudomassariella vexata]|uniref:Rhodopsin domain-containing protein n=1 Tax=Pseudomassariella vexata TaxID=1141098 RepID=A0A1Y2EFG9_9PEZI|nr:uncharacterized protein BCR38DRAFT_332542 [Pseudomassariella vexata]ORY70321.1 hypothetical protein BCR38DRAFT_332542 [Pseudomassariella vexata]